MAELRRDRDLVGNSVGVGVFSGFGAFGAFFVSCAHLFFVLFRVELFAAIACYFRFNGRCLS